jgi:hypothetical protein
LTFPRSPSFPFPLDALGAAPPIRTMTIIWGSACVQKRDGPSRSERAITVRRWCGMLEDCVEAESEKRGLYSD